MKTLKVQQHFLPTLMEIAPAPEGWLRLEGSEGFGLGFRAEEGGEFPSTPEIGDPHMLVS